jgi:hypothetical protein
MEDFMAASMDSDALTALVQFIDGPNYRPQADRPRQAGPANVICICGRDFALPFSREALNFMTPTNHDWRYFLSATLLTFCVTSFALPIVNDFTGEFIPDDRQFRNSDRWWAACVLTNAIMNMIWRPPFDPFMSIRNNPWTGLARPFAIVF